ncbi:hypothetical protein [uncultured Tyzzerella sp.]|uniref:hypothetical protein n=1 Tax=uncultured Tyzzerella sp. TaxID=2321398 RepID=UPI00294361AA|nr:hypothetical protein [uncultured Tyzzerella sp.]
MSFNELEIKVNKQGEIVIGKEITEKINLKVDDKVYISYATEEEIENFKVVDFMITKGSLKNENINFKIPKEILTDANIDLNSDLEVLCKDKKILIVPSNYVESIPEDIVKLCEDIGISKEKVGLILSFIEEEILKEEKNYEEK